MKQNVPAIRTALLNLRSKYCKEVLIQVILLSRYHKIFVTD